MRDKERKFRFSDILYPIIILGVISFFVYTGITEYSNKREKLEHVWLINNLNEPFILTSSIEYGSKSGKFLHIRTIDPQTGKILHSRELNVSSGSSAEPICMTATSLWIKKSNDWICLEFPSLKKRWNQKSFFKFLKKEHPEMGDPFSIKMFAIAFQITNTAGKTFLLDIRDLEKNTNNHDYVFFFDESNELGQSVYYYTPETRFKQPEQISIEIEGANEKKEYHWEKMNIYQKLLADSGYARNYAVFARDSSCWFFDGNHSRVAYKLVNDSLELIWQPAFNNREWLETDFLRPYKRYDEMASTRLITNTGNLGFIHYCTSLDKKENKLMLAGVDLSTQKILWDVDLTPAKIKTGCRPERSEIFNDILIIVWMDENYAGTITGVDMKTGVVKWKVRK